MVAPYKTSTCSNYIQRPTFKDHQIKPIILFLSRPLSSQFLIALPVVQALCTVSYRHKFQEHYMNNINMLS